MNGKGLDEEPARIRVHDPQTRRPVPFPDWRGGRTFNAKFQELVGEMLRRMVDAHIPPENTHSFHHGTGWIQRREDGSAMSGEVKAHSAESELRFDDVISARLSAVHDQARSVVQQMESGFIRSMYETISTAVEEVGNVIDAKGKPPTEAFLEMLRKIEFGINRDGSVTRPEIHMSPEKAEKFITALEQAGPAFEAEVDRLVTAKEAEAAEREMERRARFKTRSVSP